MTSPEDQLVPKPYDQLSSTSMDHTFQRHLSNADPNLAQREIPWPDEVDLDEIHQEDYVSVTTGIFAPEEIDAMYVASLVTSLRNQHSP
jgi:hypothetical protein